MRVTLAGHIGDKVLGALYRAADLVVVPSRYEPFGMVALEAAACGAPILASRTGGLAEVVEASHGALAGTPPQDPDRLAQAIRELLQDPDRRRRMGQEAQRFARQTYSWERTARGIVQVLRAGARSRAHSPVPTGAAQTDLRDG